MNKIIEKHNAWVKSDEGKKKVEEMKGLVERTLEKLGRDRQIDLDVLRQPICPVHPSGLWPHERV